MHNYRVSINGVRIKNENSHFSVGRTTFKRPLPIPSPQKGPAPKQKHD